MSVLQRKVQAGKQEHQARSMTVPKSLRVGLAKVADEKLGMALAVIGATQEKCTSEAVSDKLEAGALHVLLDGPNGATGGAVLGGSLVGALVQQQTTGRVAASQPTERRLTATDAALCAPLIDGLFARANGLLETQPDKDLLACFRFGARIESPRVFALALGEPEYHLIRLTIDVAVGTCQSNMMLILPMPGAQEMPMSPEAEECAVSRNRNFQTAVMGLRAELSAVLCRVQLPLSRLSELAPGNTLDVPADAFDEVELLSIEGRTIAKGAMGQVDGHRALMIPDHMTQGKARVVGNDPYSGQAAVDAADEPLEVAYDSAPLTAAPRRRSERLDSLHDLPDLPELQDGLPAGGPAALPEDDHLPELPDLPDLPDFDDGMDDFNDLPKRNIA